MRRCIRCHRLHDLDALCRDQRAQPVPRIANACRCGQAAETVTCCKSIRCDECHERHVAAEVQSAGMPGRGADVNRMTDCKPARRILRSVQLAAQFAPTGETIQPERGESRGEAGDARRIRRVLASGETW